MEYVLRRELRIERPLRHVFPFFADAGNLARITPRELGFEITTPSPIEMRAGTLIDYTIRLWGLPMRWRTLIAVWEPPHRFVDVQVKGPYKQWIHTHSFEAAGEATIIRDEVRYILPFALLGRLIHPLIRRQLDRIFDYRGESVVRLAGAGWLSG
jgi:ligand-binding SRPBCC domain-containing protein